jgi:hypothetical protein
MRLGFLMLTALSLRAELIDRVAVSVGTAVITESELLEQMRVRALIEGSPLRLDADSKRDAADRLIQQALIRKEIDTTHYIAPEASLAEPLLSAFKQTRFNNDDAQYREALRSAGIGEPELMASFLWQLTVLRFIEFRFRPGIQISAEDTKDYYERRFLPDWRSKTNDAAPTFEDAARTIEELLVQERIDNQLDRWITMARTQVSIRYREEVFRDK